MVVMAHPDDADYSCSGTVAKLCRDGLEVVYVVVTDGSKGTEDRSITPGQLAKMRKDEQVAAGKVLGLKDVVFLGYPDGYLQPSLELRRDVAREIRRFKPDILITGNPTRTLTSDGYLGHPDHFAAAEAALAATYPAARDHLTFPELLAEGLVPHKVREVWVVDAEHPNHWVDVSETLETAIKALQAHASQVDGERAASLLREWRSDAGKPNGMQYAESFKRIVLD